METKEKHGLMIRTNYKPASEPRGSQSRKFLDVRVKASSAVWMSLVTSPGIQVNFLSGTHSSRHEDCLNMSYCGHFSEVYIELFTCSLPGFGEKGSFCSSPFQVKSGRKLERLVWTAIAEYQRRPEFRIQWIFPSYKWETKPQTN